MKFDIKKFTDHVEAVGVAYLKNMLIINPISVNWDILFSDIFDNSFNPLDYSSDYGIFTALKLDIKDFLVDDTVTGVEAIQALLDGKTLLLYENEYVIKDGLLCCRNKDTYKSFNDIMTDVFTIKATHDNYGENAKDWQIGDDE